MGTEGIEGISVETRNYGATAAFWKSMGFERQPFEPQHWAVVEAFVSDPDGRTISLQAPLPKGVVAIDEHTHHELKYGSP